MQIGVMVPHTGRLASPGFVRQFSRSAEDAGFGGLWASDHLLVPTEFVSSYTLGHSGSATVASEDLARTMGLNLEMISTLAVLAACTERVTIGSAVSVLPIRNPILNARQLASIDQYSGGRLMFGAGVGWLREEAEAMGMPWDRRGRRSDEHLQLLRSFWTATDKVEFRGEFFEVPEVRAEPHPYAGSIPILVGGHSNAALSRAARIADGWISGPMSPDRLSATVAVLEEHWTSNDRPGAPIVVCRASGLDNLSPNSASARQATERIHEYQAIGVDQLIISAEAGSVTETLDRLAWWRTELLGSCRGTQRGVRSRLDEGSVRQ